MLLFFPIVSKSVTSEFDLSPVLLDIIGSLINTLHLGFREGQASPSFSWVVCKFEFSAERKGLLSTIVLLCLLGWGTMARCRSIHAYGLVRFGAGAKELNHGNTSKAALGGRNHHAGAECETCEHCF